MEEKGYLSYGETEIETIKKGLPAIREVLLGDNTHQKRRLLFALDWFMDSYYGQDIWLKPFREELVELLQVVILSAQEDEVASDALDLLESYEWPPFPILERQIDQVSERLKPFVLRLIHTE
ncbi:MAG TPA: hypothetical protein H9841_07325 [Candidatus Flavonifractor merdigallinarum]|uniref:Uncharacterized protein n=1 Tax=Candidatus Flavonifractor merdigallinarum TaxID=2838589 RepID=A0A9D2BXY5_9FIRM|nr:hypothetical protein [Candidatus Flavonifractor merdigallinarum]